LVLQFGLEFDCYDGLAKLVAHLRRMTAVIVVSFVAKNALKRADVPRLIHTTYEALSLLGSAGENEVRLPAVPVGRSVGKQFLLCLECGQMARILTRHLMAAHGLTPEHYRDKWGLSSNYPMVSPDYAKLRLALAKRTGFQPKKAAGRRGM
jgi:predicted transcriptional regulator